MDYIVYNVYLTKYKYFKSKIFVYITLIYHLQVLINNKLLRYHLRLIKFDFPLTRYGISISYLEGIPEENLIMPQFHVIKYFSVDFYIKFNFLLDDS